MSRITRAVFSHSLLDDIRNDLWRLKEASTPQTYEIEVDGMTVVALTDNPAHFDGVDFYIDEATTQRVIVKFKNAQRNHSRKTVLYLPQNLSETERTAIERQSEDGLEALERREVQVLSEQIQTSLTQEELQKRLKDKIRDYDLLEAYTNALEEKLHKLAQRKFQWGDTSLTEVFGGVLSETLRQNPGWLRKLPGGIGEQLASAIEAENEERKMSGDKVVEKETDNPDTSTHPALSESEQQWLNLGKEVQSRLLPVDFVALMEFMGMCANNPRKAGKGIGAGMGGFVGGIH